MIRVSSSLPWLAAALAVGGAWSSAVGQQDAAQQDDAQREAASSEARSDAAPQGEAEVFDRTPQDCIVVSQINQTDAIDDQNLLFHMRGKRIYRSHLPRKCPGLQRENRIAYETRNGKLCSSDVITVLEQFGVSLQRGFTCRLGEFVPLSPDEIEDIDFRKRERRSGSGIEARSVEVEDAESEEADGERQTDGDADGADSGDGDREP
jgi:hypothetical protein